jgi:hypothetical protein
MLLSNNEEIRAVRITVTGDFEGISLDRTQLLQSLYTTIDCRYVEVVQPTETICLWVEEEGLLNRSDPNLRADQLVCSGRLVPAEGPGDPAGLIFNQPLVYRPCVACGSPTP